MSARLALPATVAGAVALLASSLPAHAITYAVSVHEASGAGQFNAVNASAAALAARPDASSAAFTYNGPLAFSDTAPDNSSNAGDLTSAFFGPLASGISGYTGTGPATVAYGASGANYLTLAGYLGTSGSVNGYGYGSFYQFTSATGSYGGTNLTITHDDGVSVYANNSLTPLPGTTAGPTSAVTETVFLPTGTTSFEIAYGRENGSPSILEVAVPEPLSLVLLGSGLVLTGLVRARKAPRRLPA